MRVPAKQVQRLIHDATDINNLCAMYSRTPHGGRRAGREGRALARRVLARSCGTRTRTHRVFGPHVLSSAHMPDSTSCVQVHLVDALDVNTGRALGAFEVHSNRYEFASRER